MHLPNRFLIHRVDHYTASTTRDSAGGQVVTYTLANSDVPCCVLEEYSKVYDVYLQRDEEERVTMHLLDEAVFDTLSMNDRIVFQGQNYRVYSLHDVGNQGVYFRVELQREVV